tara:strand:+ start:5027 stop:6334 length:1308 start_codon:yes stop_codon:yes gene_type:complete
METGLEHFMAHPLLYLSMPIVSAVVGYVTNVVAIWMMFNPIEFFGIKPPFLGWQGIIPRRAAKMASISVDTITEHLITQEEIFSRLDADRVASELEGPLNEMIEDIVDQVMLAHQPALWESLPNMVKNQIYRRIKSEAPELITEIMETIKGNLSQMFDLKDMVITNLTRDRALLNTIFQEVGAAEFRFIGRSGLYFGFIFGIIQMCIWIFFKAWWQLPAFGLACGYATNWIALQMIFNPKEIMRIGPFNVQGLFMKRQDEVAYDYGRLVSANVLTPANIIEGVLRGPYSDKVFALIGRRVQKTIDEQSSIAKPFVAFVVGTAEYRRMKDTAVTAILQRLPDALTHIESYAEDALDLENTLATRLQSLKPAQFESMLRPAFEQDEWILITVGAVLGFFVGIFQLFAMFGGPGGGDPATMEESARLGLELLRLYGIG